MLKLGVKTSHLAINLDASNTFADFGMETIGKIKGQGSFGKVDNVAFWSIDKNFVSKEIEAKFFDVDFFAGAEFGCGLLEFGNPEKVGREMLDFTGFVIFS